jgi:probable HAF family extracellular repeat protein
LAEGIKASGEIVGYSYAASNCAYNALLYSNGNKPDLGTLGGSSYLLSSADSINHAGQIVGWSYTAGGPERLFV